MSMINENIKTISLKSLPTTIYTTKSEGKKIPFCEYSIQKNNTGSGSEIMECYLHNLKLLECILNDMVSEFIWDISYEKTHFDREYHNNKYPLFYDALDYSHYQNTHFLETVAVQISQMAIVDRYWVYDNKGNGELAKIVNFSKNEGYYTMACCDSWGNPMEDEECKSEYLVYPFGGIKNRDRIVKALRADLDDIDFSKLLKDVMNYEYCKYDEFIKQLSKSLFCKSIEELKLPSLAQKEQVYHICERILSNVCERFFQKETYYNTRRAYKNIENKIKKLKENKVEPTALSEPKEDEL